jgi:hypothetical protein
VEGACADHKDMPNHGVERSFPPSIKDQAYRIRKPAPNRQGQAERRDVGDFFFQGNDSQPAHENIEDHRDFPKFRDINNLHEDSKNKSLRLNPPLKKGDIGGFVLDCSEKIPPTPLGKGGNIISGQVLSLRER